MSVFTPGWAVVSGEVATASKFSQLGANDDYLKDAIDKGIPAGAVMAYTSSTPPAGWLVCDGSAVSRSTYANLFAVIGTSRGAGNGTTTFNLPNLKGRTIVGRDSGQSEFSGNGQTGGEKTHVLGWNEMPVHNHGAHQDAHRHWVGNVGTAGGYGFIDGPHATSSGAAYSDYQQPNVWTDNAGSGQAHNNLQPYDTETYIIKF